MTTARRNAPPVPELAPHFTVYNYARRGRGASGDTLPYAVEREIEDIAALIAEAGGSAHLFGASSGAALALEAAAAGLTIDRIAVYEMPYSTTDDMSQRYPEYVEELGHVLDKGPRGDAIALFMRLAGSAEEDIVAAKNSPMWPGLEVLCARGVRAIAMQGHRRVEQAAGGCGVVHAAVVG